MCSSPKSSAVSNLKKVPTSPLTSSELNSFVSIANAADARREEKELAEKESMALEMADTAVASLPAASLGGSECDAEQPKSRSLAQRFNSIRTALTVPRAWGAAN